MLLVVTIAKKGSTARRLEPRLRRTVSTAKSAVTASSLEPTPPPTASCAAKESFSPLKVSRPAD